ncbi:E2F transcription factor-like E2FE isoform X2 [Benincasa hispida]|uniref:E2F transcription factor-like E2FE isoform X2 n=1 Tax=Benincasa hispida TaxID=102211 RepID=UPI001900CFA2|nr:E2F transcription factor-like E2FE isoform X2 [Benincasa hispida]
MAANLHRPVPHSSSSAYSRKQKSLGLLCANFLRLYDRDDVQLISLDNAASRLGVERRRIYDIVNVLESVGILCRKAKNQYSWIGFSGIPKALRQLKEEDPKGNCSTIDENDNSKLIDDEDETCSDLTSVSHESKSSASARYVASDNRREKSLALLTQNFVKLFICSNAHVISLDEAAKLLLGDAQSASIMRSKVRRLYDIANVLAAIHLIEKTQTVDTRKPAFRWLGLRGRVENCRAGKPVDSNKRSFGTDITNINLKKNRLANSFDLNKSPNSQQQKHVQLEGCGVEADGGELERDTNCKSFKFGPFSPSDRLEAKASRNEANRCRNNWVSLASAYHPQYQNQGMFYSSFSVKNSCGVNLLEDKSKHTSSFPSYDFAALRELFSHYKEAWKLWYSETVNRS